MVDIQAERLVLPVGGHTICLPDVASFLLLEVTYKVASFSATITPSNNSPENIAQFMCVAFEERIPAHVEFSNRPQNGKNFCQMPSEAPTANPAMAVLSVSILALAAGIQNLFPMDFQQLGSLRILYSPCKCL